MENDIEKYKKDLQNLLEKHNRLNLQDEPFNVFTTLRQAHDERYLHSRFISSILNPKPKQNGKHGLGNYPLEVFLKKIGSQFECTNETEIKPNPDDNWSEEKNIDIFIDNLKHKNNKEEYCANRAIIIENKIYAKDQDEQLHRYYNNKVREKENDSSRIEVYYLTLDRHKPSDNSLGETLKVEGNDHNRIKTVRCIDYATEIKNWLDEVSKTSGASNFLKSAIEQYLALVTKLTCDLKYNKELTDFVCENWKNWENTAKIVRNENNNYPQKEYEILREDFKHVYWHVVTDFLEKLYENLIGEGLEIEIEKPIHESITEIVHRKKRKPFKYSFNNGWVLQADEHRIGNVFFIGYGYNPKSKQWNRIHYIKDDNNELLVDLWDCLNDETKGTKTIETILKNNDSIIEQYAEFVKKELEKFGTKK
ncbi:MAG: PD-(D/E)XK nuclease family protein [Bacteroidales bacterium]|nr:PD-(D/E)XK nuclease family protein [Bacteroidales bacterium]